MENIVNSTYFNIPYGIAPDFNMYFRTNEGVKSVLTENEIFINYINKRILYSDINFTNKVGEFYWNQIYDKTSKTSSGPLNFILDDGIIYSINTIPTIEGVDITSNITITPIISGQGNYLGTSGLITIESIINDPVKTLYFYFNKKLLA